MRTRDPKWGGFWSPEPLQADGSRFPSMGPIAVAWIEAACVHGEGAWRGRPVRFEGWQREFLRRLMLYDPVTVDYLVADALLVSPEGIGKTAIGSWWSMFMFVGPCRPPATAPSMESSAYVPMLSASRDLAGRLWEGMRAAVEGGPLNDLIDVQKNVAVRTDGAAGLMERPAASGLLQEGGNPSAIAVDEMHVMGEDGVKGAAAETISAVTRKRTKRPVTVPRLIITTPDDGDPSSPLGKLWSRAERAVNGEVDDPSMLVVHYCADEPVDVDDPADLRRAIRQATPASWVDPDKVARKREVERMSPQSVKRYSLGLFAQGDDAVFDDGVLEAFSVRDRSPATETEPETGRTLVGAPPASERCALAFDGSISRDSTALYLATPALHGLVVGHWERPPGAHRRWKVPKPQVLRVVRWAMEVRWPNAYLAVDPSHWRDWVEDWEEAWPDRVVVDYEQPVHSSRAWARYRGAVNDEVLTHDGDQAFLRHWRNAREIMSARTKRAVLAKRTPGRPIDLAVTATYAVDLAMSLPSPGSRRPLVAVT